MPQTIVIDFETYYDKDYHLRQKGMTYLQFILDKRFHVFGMAVNYDSGVSEWISGDDVQAWLAAHSEDILVAHQGFFDFAVLFWHYKFRPAYMVDTLLMANHVLGSARDKGGTRNDVASLATRLGLKAKGRIEFMKGVRHPDEQQMQALISYAINDAEIERQILNRLLPQFSNPDFEFWLMDHTIRIYLERPLQIDPEKLKNVREIVQKRQAELLALSGTTRDVLASDKKFPPYLTEVLKKHKIKLPMKKAAKPRKDGTQPMIPALSKGDAKFIELSESDIPEVRNLIQARLAVRSAATVIARLATMQKYIDWGVGIPVHLVYYGGHTGRFSGGGGFNFQNLTSPDRAQDDIDKLIAQLVRQAIQAPAGKVFVPVDAAQIEARVLAWLAGEEELVEAFRSGTDIYSKFISDVLGEDIHKPTEEDKKDAAKAQHLILMRGAGKIAVLGLGFQMGADKFFKQMESKDKNLAKMIKAGKITLEFAADVVKGYRDTYQNIAAFWGKIDKAFHRARQGIETKLGPLTFKRIGMNAVSITLPSGRALYYRNIRQEAYKGKRKFTNVKGKWQDAKDQMEWKHGAGQKIYGGLLTENVVQAIARDILVEQGIFAAEQAGYPVNIHIHDEVVPVADEKDGEKALAFLIKSLSTAPSWGEGMALSAEGKVSRSLGK